MLGYQGIQSAVTNLCFFLIILEPVTIKEAFLEWLVVGSSCFSIRFAIVFVAV